jgi:hypothetical protein
LSCGDPATRLHLALLDKSQVIELDLIRQKIANNPTGLIRRKFSIDGAEMEQQSAVSTNSKP